MSNIFPLSEYGIQQSIILLSRTIRNWIDDNIAYIKQLDKNYQTLNKVTKPGLYYLRGTESGSPNQLLGEGLLVVINHGRYPIELASEELYCKDLQLVIDYSTLDFMFRVKDGQDKEFVTDWNYKLMGQRGGEGDQSMVTGVGSRALTYASHGGGVNSIAGCYCFTISRDKTKSFDHVYGGNTYGVYKLDSIIGIEAGDTISLQLNYVKDFYATVLAVAGDSNDQAYGITLKSNQILIDKEIYKNDQYVPEEHGEPTLWLPYKPTMGTMPLGQSQVVFGTDCIASGEESFATGLRSKALSKYAFVWGRDGVAAYASMAGGRECQATGESSFAVGHRTIASGVRAFAANTSTQATGAYSTAFGQGTEAKAQGSFTAGAYTVAEEKYSAAFGYHTRTNSRGQLVAGRYNQGKANTLFEIGNGLTDENRRNAFEVQTDGSANVKAVNDTEFSVINRKALEEEYVAPTTKRLDLLEQITSIRNTTKGVGLVEIVSDVDTVGHVTKTNSDAEVRLYKDKNINLIKVRNSGSGNGVSLIKNDQNDTLSFEGTNTKDNWAVALTIAKNSNTILPKGTYTLSITSDNDSFENHADLKIYMSGIPEGETSSIRFIEINNLAEAQTFTVTTDTVLTACVCYLIVPKGKVFSGETWAIKLEPGDQATGYVPYSTFEVIEDGSFEIQANQDYVLMSTTNDEFSCDYSMGVQAYIDKRLAEMVASFK